MLITEINGIIAAELKIKATQVGATVALLDEGNTVPFIARYRKEATGELNEEDIRTIEERLAYLRSMVKRQDEIIAKIEEQGKLTDELRTAIENAKKLQELEDLYLPYKQKKRTRAMVAREKGLEPLAALMLLQDKTSGTPEEFAAEFIDEEKGVLTAEDALAGARDILAEELTEDAALRQKIREKLWKDATLTTTLDKEAAEAQTFLMYDEGSEPVRSMPSHRILAINRGEKKDCLKVKLAADFDALCDEIYRGVYRAPSIFSEHLKAAIDDGAKRLLFPALEREIRSALTETAEKQAIHIFGENLRQLLLAAPLTGHTVMGLDPGYRTGCKVAIVDATGRLLDHDVFYVTMSEAQKEQSAKKALALIKKYNVTLISLGNGTASYETEVFVAELIKNNNLSVRYLITNEAGASVYSASKLAKEELPDYDVTVRGAVSIARRVQDPLAELVKIDPKAIGVGQYQHDVNQKELTETLDKTVESAVNHVGVELNTASAALLKHIAGINATLAKNIVAYRDEHGRFKSRKELMEVPRLGKAAFTQCAGFLRIEGAAFPLDNTSVHPESYKLAEKLLARLGSSLDELTDKANTEKFAEKLKNADANALATELEAGAPTVRDIIAALLKPGRDPREDVPPPVTRSAIVKLSDLQVGSVVTGTVRNVTDFGVFVDIGLKTAGLIHISELAHRRVKHPLEVVSVGEIIKVVILSVDEARGRIALSLKQVPKEETA